MRRTTALILIAIGAAVAATSSTLLAQQARSVNDGVYAPAQAKRGEMLYADTCAACHDAKLAGGIGPQLAGMDFVASWKDSTVGDLFDKIKTSMPASDPGSLSPQQTADVLSFILSANRYPGGTSEMGTDVAALKGIHMAEPKAGSSPVSSTAPSRGGAHSLLEGLYAQMQSARGQKLYAETCAVCHGPQLTGDIGPALAGPRFVARWKDKTVGDLFEKVKTTMPASTPGSLTPEQTADVLAFVFSANNYPAGASDLATDAAPLKAISIAAPPQK